MNATMYDAARDELGRPMVVNMDGQTIASVIAPPGIDRHATLPPEIMRVVDAAAAAYAAGQRHAPVAPYDVGNGRLYWFDQPLTLVLADAARFVGPTSLVGTGWVGEYELRANGRTVGVLHVAHSRVREGWLVGARED